MAGFPRRTGETFIRWGHVLVLFMLNASFISSFTSRQNTGRQGNHRHKKKQPWKAPFWWLLAVLWEVHLIIKRSQEKTWQNELRELLPFPQSCFKPVPRCGFATFFSSSSSPRLSPHYRNHLTLRKNTEIKQRRYLSLLWPCFGSGGSTACSPPKSG